MNAIYDNVLVSMTVASIGSRRFAAEEMWVDLQKKWDSGFGNWKDYMELNTVEIEEISMCQVLIIVTWQNHKRC